MKHFYCLFILLTLLVRAVSSSYALDFPLYTEVEFTKLSDEVLINPEYTGNIGAIRGFDIKGSLIADKSMRVEQTVDGWYRILFPGSLLRDLVVTGQKGSLRVFVISEKKKVNAIAINEFYPVNEPVIVLGQLDLTLVSGIKMDISRPSEFEVAVLDHKSGGFIKGDIVAICDNQLGIKFKGLPDTVVSKEGVMRISLKLSERIFNLDLGAWGYNVFVSETDVEKPAFIKAQVFGLPEETRLRFKFRALAGQKIVPETVTATVGEINSGKPLATVKTSIPGFQPLSVSVEKTN